jgi:Flp pilus assembly protein TadD
MPSLMPASMRLKSTWLIRRGRALLRAGRKAEAEADLAQALAELDTRIRPESPDLSLVCDRALIHALTGRKDDARRELDEAKTKGASEWMLRNAETALSQ